MKKYAKPAIVGAMIRLGNCLDLLDPENVRSLRRTCDEILPTWNAERAHVPRNVLSKKSIDCAILNYVHAKSDGTEPKIETSRGVFVPTNNAKRAWPGSWIYDEAHIQVCVREQRNILAVRHVRPDGRYGKDEGGEQAVHQASHA